MIWVHDYHFLLLGEALRELGVDNPIGFFLHIPFPAPEIFRAIPEHSVLARALCHYNLVGFQTPQDAGNFGRYLTREWNGKPIDHFRYTAFGQETHIQDFPIGIDGQEFAQMAGNEIARAANARLNRWLGVRNLIIGIDRMDYTKGLPERFEAIGDLLDTNPDLRGQLSFTQIAPAFT